MASWTLTAITKHCNIIDCIIISSMSNAYELIVIYKPKNRYSHNMRWVKLIMMHLVLN